MTFFGGPVYPNMPYVQKTVSEPSWMNRVIDIFQNAFGNQGSAILLLGIVVFAVYLKFGRKK